MKLGLWSGWRKMGAVCLVGGLLLASPAYAQDDEPKGPWREANINYAETAKPWLQWTLGCLFAALCLSIAFKNPHRSHLD